MHGKDSKPEIDEANDPPRNLGARSLDGFQEHLGYHFDIYKIPDCQLSTCRIAAQIRCAEKANRSTMA